MPFQHVPEHKILGVRMAYDDGQVLHEMPPQEQVAPGRGDVMFWATWPVPNMGPRYVLEDAIAGSEFDPVDSSDFDLTTDDGQLAFVKGLADWRWLYRDGSGSPTRYDYVFAWFNSDAFDDYGFAYWSRAGWGLCAAAGRTASGRYRGTFAHEHGHSVYGFGDNIDPPAIGIDGYEPFLENGAVGWDVLRAAHKTDPAVDSTTPALMLQGYRTTNRWVPPHHYVPKIGVKPECAKGGTLQAFYPIHFDVPADPQNPAALDPTVRFVNYVDLTPSLEGNVLIRVLDSLEAELYSTAFDVPAGERTTGATNVPALPDVYRVELYRDGNLEDALERSDNPPVVTILSPAPGATLDGATVVQWTASDADGDLLRTLVQYSHNGGLTWRPLAANAQGSQLTLDADRLPSGDNAAIKVVVSDGLNTTEAQVTDLHLQPNRPPVVFIVSPQQNDSFRFASNVPLQGTAHDPEEGFLDPSQLEWYSDRDGFLGTGTAIHGFGMVSDVPLSLGTHTIELRATDGSGAVSSDYVTITIE